MFSEQQADDTLAVGALGPFFPQIFLQSTQLEDLPSCLCFIGVMSGPISILGGGGAGRGKAPRH